MLTENLNFMNTQAEKYVYVKSVALLYALSIDSWHFDMYLTHAQLQVNCVASQNV